MTWPRPRCPPCLQAARRERNIFLCLQQSPCPHTPVFPMPAALRDCVCPGHPPTAALPSTAAPSPLPVPSPESAHSVPAPTACSQPECCWWHRKDGESPALQGPAVGRWDCAAPAAAVPHPASKAQPQLHVCRMGYVLGRMGYGTMGQEFQWVVLLVVPQEPVLAQAKMQLCVCDGMDALPG